MHAARHRAVSRLHLWWSQKPDAACRAVLFASLVDDPGEGGVDGEDAPGRAALCDLVARLSAGEPGALREARRRLALAHPDGLPTVCDPFCGGGSIAAEARRLGLPVWASDLNPVAVLSTAALIDFPARFAAAPALHPADTRGRRAAAGRGAGAAVPLGLAADVLFYGRRVRDAAEDRLASLYPAAPGGEPVIAWLWCRTARCPNPACGAEMPLVSSFLLCRRPGRSAWIAPRSDHRGGGVRFEIGPDCGSEAPPAGTCGRTGAACLTCGQVAPLHAVRREGRSRGLGTRLLAIVAAAPRGRRYLPPEPQHDRTARSARPAWSPATELAPRALGVSVAQYGLRRHSDLFTPRQLVALTTFSDLVREARGWVLADARRAGRPDDGVPLRSGGHGAPAYADAVATYLALALDRAAARWCTLARWQRSRENIEHPFASPGLQMAWDFAEANPFSPAAGSWMDAVEAVADALNRAPRDGPAPVCRQMDASRPEGLPEDLLVCTDPPYFANLPYADTSDLYYVWLRRTVGDLFPDLCRTVLTPKAAELVADPHRHGGGEAARRRFLEGMEEALRQVRRRGRPDLPLVLFYALRQSRPAAAEGGGARAAVGWAAMLDSLLGAGFQITGTWPLRTEHAGRRRSLGSNTLGSSIVLVCRRRGDDAPEATLGEVARQLRRELPRAVGQLAAAGLAPVDLAQAAIGPGMAVFSRYARVLAADGTAVPASAALQLINREMDACLAAGDADLDPASRFCLAWFEQFGFSPRPYADADVLLRAKDTAMEDLMRLGVVVGCDGTVRLRRRGEPAPGGTPAAAARDCVWTALQLLLETAEEGGAAAARDLLRNLGSRRSGSLRGLIYRVAGIAERRGLAAEAHALAAVATCWSGAGAAAADDGAESV
jgi:putative DNA methylase